MVTYAFGDEEDTRRTYMVGSVIHSAGRVDATGAADITNADGAVIATKNRSGRWNCQFEGPGILDSGQRDACVEAVASYLEALEPEPAAPARRSRSSRSTPES